MAQESKYARRVGMKRLLSAAALAMLLLGSSPSPAAAQADVRVFGGSAEVTNMLAQGCGEYIRFSGTVRWVTTFVSIPTDRQLVIIRFVDTNLTGVGETSGTTYRLVLIQGQTNMESNDRVVVDTEELTLKVFGGDQIYTVKGLAHLTVTPSGEITASFANQTVECSP
jgi:hypothetical protein